MNTLKYIFPMIIGVIVLIAGLTLFNSSEVEAQSEGPNCYINDVDYICRTTASVDCICGEKVGSDPEGL